MIKTVIAIGKTCIMENRTINKGQMKVISPDQFYGNIKLYNIFYEQKISNPFEIYNKNLYSPFFMN